MLGDAQCGECFLVRWLMFSVQTVINKGHFAG